MIGECIKEPRYERARAHSRENDKPSLLEVCSEKVCDIGGGQILKILALYTCEVIFRKPVGS